MCAVDLPAIDSQSRAEKWLPKSMWYGDDDFCRRAGQQIHVIIAIERKKNPLPAGVIEQLKMTHQRD